MFHVEEENRNTRLDIFLAEKLPGISRSNIQKYLRGEEGFILVNAVQKKAHYLVKPGDEVQVTIPPPIEMTVEPVKISLDILYEDEDILVINKPTGVPVHPAAGHYNDTIVNALLYYFGKKSSLSDIGGALRPGIVHRLDKDTSGVLLITKNNQSHELIAREFSKREVKKSYEAILKGVVYPPEGIIDRPIARSPKHRKKFIVTENGREALTRYETIDSKKNTTWVRLMPKTGRTHQLRVHAAHIGHPIVGDSLYARKSHQSDIIALVARELSITHPQSKMPMTFTAPYPEHFLNLAARLGYSIQ